MNIHLTGRQRDIVWGVAQLIGLLLLAACGSKATPTVPAPTRVPIAQATQPSLPQLTQPPASQSTQASTAATALNPTMPPPTAAPMTSPVAVTQASPTTRENTGVVTGVVIDQSTGQPLAGAMVWYGAGTPRMRTGPDGQYQFEVSWGSVSINVLARGYERGQRSATLARGQTVMLMFNLRPLAQPPIPADLVGTVELSVSAAGSASERKLYRLRVAGQAEPLLLFDEIGWNDRLNAFVPWVGKKVHVVGYYGVGRYGWDAREAEGVYVEAISAE